MTAGAQELRTERAQKGIASLEAADKGRAPQVADSEGGAPLAAGSGGQSNSGCRRVRVNPSFLEATFKRNFFTNFDSPVCTGLTRWEVLVNHRSFQKERAFLLADLCMHCLCDREGSEKAAERGLSQILPVFLHSTHCSYETYSYIIRLICIVCVPPLSNKVIGCVPWLKTLNQMLQKACLSN